MPYLTVFLACLLKLGVITHITGNYLVTGHLMFPTAVAFKYHLQANDLLLFVLGAGQIGPLPNYPSANQPTKNVALLQKK